MLEAIQPVGIEAALQAREVAGAEQDEKRKALELALERARYEADRARRQFDAVEPENRLVAAELESRWNQALAKAAELEQRVQNMAKPAQPLDQERQKQLLRLSEDLPALWNHPQAPAELKKRILRTVLNEIIVDSQQDPHEHQLQLHWAGGVHTPLRVVRNKTGQHQRRASDTIIDLVRELAKVCADKTIAAVLNRLGYSTGQGKSWNASRVAGLRGYHKIAPFLKQEGWLTREQTARELQVSNTVIKRLIREGVLPAKQVVACAPWVIERKDLERPEVIAPVQALRQGRQLPLTVPGQGRLPLESVASERWLVC